MTINKFRSHLYKLSRILGDVQAVTHKNPSKAVPKRVGRRLAGKITGKLLGALIPPTRK